VLAAITASAIVATGCGAVLGAQHAAHKPATRATPSAANSHSVPGDPNATAAGNRRKAAAEAARLLRLVQLPTGAVRLSRPSPLIPFPKMGRPATTSLIDDSAFWKVPLSMTALLAWLGAHPQGELPQSGSTTESGPGGPSISGYGYSGPSNPAWVQAQVEVGVASLGTDSSLVRGDGQTIWVDPTPLRDVRPGLRTHLAAMSHCPTTDRGLAGVTNPSLRSLTKSLLPAGRPTAGLVCEYFGANGNRFGLKASKVLDRPAAGELATRVGELSLGHVDGSATSCPADDGSATIVALAYPRSQSIDLWLETTGCASTSNGYIYAESTVTI
jgi:hypothetical protein